MSEIRETVSEKVFNGEGAVMIPKYVFDLEMARGERHTKRWFIAFFVVLAMLFATNIGWVIYESQFEEISYEQEAHYDTAVDTSILNNGTGSVYYGDSGKTESDGSGEEIEQHETMP